MRGCRPQNTQCGLLQIAIVVASLGLLNVGIWSDERSGFCQGIVSLRKHISERRESSRNRHTLRAIPETNLPRAPLPTSARSMAIQAAETAIEAYRAGVTRQSVRLRLDMVCSVEKAIESGMEAFLKETLPLAQLFTERLALPGGAELQGVRISSFDAEGLLSGDVGTLLYRESAEPSQDAAVCFLAGRNFAVEDQAQTFLAGMKTRLVVFCNSEDAASQFRIENAGKEFVWGGASDIGRLQRFCEDFKEETYYYRLKFLNDWSTRIFRVYPHPWEVYIDGLDGTVVKLFESNDKPKGEDVIQQMNDYEQRNSITVAQKREYLRSRR